MEAPFPTKITDQASYEIEIDGKDYEVVPAETCRDIEARMVDLKEQVDAVNAWNEAEEPEGAQFEHWDRAMALLHNRHSKFDLARLIADLLGGKTPKVLK